MCKGEEGHCIGHVHTSVSRSASLPQQQRDLGQLCDHDRSETDSGQSWLTSILEGAESTCFSQTPCVSASELLWK